jgi:hypothetical protein
MTPYKTRTYGTPAFGSIKLINNEISETTRSYREVNIII